MRDGERHCAAVACESAPTYKSHRPYWRCAVGRHGSFLQPALHLLIATTSRLPTLLFALLVAPSGCLPFDATAGANKAFWIGLAPAARSRTGTQRSGQLSTSALRAILA